MPTLQANLRQARGYANRLIEAGVPVLLVKGAHLESAKVAYRWGKETDVASLRLAHQLHAGGVDLAIGTHDPVIREAVTAAFPDVEVQMLLGVRPADAHDLMLRGHPVRLSVPYGKTGSAISAPARRGPRRLSTEVQRGFCSARRAPAAQHRLAGQPRTERATRSMTSGRSSQSQCPAFS